MTLASSKMACLPRHNNVLLVNSPYEKKRVQKHKTGVRRPGIEPGPIAWEAMILPLDQRRVFRSK